MIPEKQTNYSIRALIVDDEERARNLLEKLLLRIPGIEICGKAASADEAIEMVIANRPDIVFLDVQMPEKSGFRMVENLQKFLIDSKVVFVTAHAEFAVDAFRVSAFDYLLKPVMMEQLKETVLKYKAEQSQIAVKRIQPCKLKFNTRTGYILVSPDEIMYCEANVNYTTFYFGKENKEVVTVNLGKVEELLSSYSFFRISRSVLINTSFLKKADRQKKKCLIEKGAEKIWLDIPPNNIRELEKIIDS
ncbi:MAG: response regulator transcription factor [Prolixibacteraceae bacterium]|nr:response regulator transcription factor [Prolixibacteraceae bacterium]